MKGILIFQVLLLIVVLGGWSVNLYKLTQCDWESPYKAEVLRTAGLVPPIGAVVAWIDLGK